MLSFRLANFAEADEVAQQLFHFDPRSTKALLFTDQTLADTDTGVSTH